VAQARAEHPAPQERDSFMVGNIRVEAIHTPGHTPEHLSYLITDLGGGADQPIALASGDFVFVGDVGRPDLLESAAGKKGATEPAARQLQESLHNRLTPFADFLQILPGHGAGSACGKELGAVPTTTLGYERRFNGALKLALNDPEAFIKHILAGQPEPPLYFATMKRVNRDGIGVTEALRPPPVPTSQRVTRFYSSWRTATMPTWPPGNSTASDSIKSWVGLALRRRRRMDCSRPVSNE
jgi:hydroxyacylglutathione hydrolase